MGIGDEIIASGHAKTEFAKHGKRVLICDVHMRPRWSAMWQGLSWIATPNQSGPDVVRMRNAPRCRPYIDYKKGFTRRGGLNYSGWRVRDNPGWIQLTSDEERAADEALKNIARPFVVVEPIVKPSANPNKQWGHKAWGELARLLLREGYNPVQIGPPGVNFRLDEIPHVVTNDFRIGVAAMARARWSFLPDGGLHHAAGVLGLPATVMWGGTNDPDILGYPGHENIYFPTVCGRWLPCPHCRKIWDWIKPDYVLDRTLENQLWQK